VPRALPTPSRLRNAIRYPNWIRQHEMGHHLETNHHEKDPDVTSPYPAVRFHARLPAWLHHTAQMVCTSIVGCNTFCTHVSINQSTKPTNQPTIF